jgi:hypothetical protein
MTFHLFAKVPEAKHYAPDATAVKQIQLVIDKGPPGNLQQSLGDTLSQRVKTRRQTPG